MDIFDDKTDREDDPFVRYQSEQQDHSDLNKTILFISMVSFSIVLFFVIGLYLYARYIFTRQSRNRRTTTTIHRLNLTALPVSEPQPEPPNTTGLDPSLIASLPTFTVRPKILEAMECAVCLNPLEGGETAKVLPNCKHVFHVGCIDTWLGSHATCPLCRARVQVRLQPQNREGPVGTLALDGGSPLVLEATSSHGGDDGLCELCKNCDSNSRLSSFRRILSGRERSSRRVQPSSRDDDVDQDLERQ